MCAQSVSALTTESEEYMLSCALQGKDNFFLAAASGITSEHFQTPNAAQLWKAIADTAGHGGDTMPDDVRLYHPGFDRGRLMGLMCRVGSSMYLGMHITRMLDSRRRVLVRQMLKAALDAASKEPTAGASFDDYWSDVFPHIDKAITSSSGTQTRTLKDMCEAYKNQIKHPEIKREISTGWDEIDRWFGKPRAGEEIIIAARPSCGKSTIALQIAHAVAGQDKRALVFSAEMSGEELVGRLVCMRGGRFAKYDPAVACDEADKLALLSRLTIFDNEIEHTMSGTDARCRAFSSLEGGIGAVVVDYLGLIVPDDHRAPREQQISGMSRKFKKLAGYLKCPVFVLCQLNREIEKSGKPRPPMLSDLRESGAIEQDADRVWFLSEDPEFLAQHPSGELPDEIIIRLIQAKCRGGKRNIEARMHFNQPLFRMWPVNGKAA